VTDWCRNRRGIPGGETKKRKYKTIEGKKKARKGEPLKLPHSRKERGESSKDPEAISERIVESQTPGKGSRAAANLRDVQH